MRLFSCWKRSKNKNIDPHQNLTYSYIEKCTVRSTPFNDTCLKFTAIFHKIVIILLGRNTPNNKFVDVTNKETKKVTCYCCWSPSFMTLEQLIINPLFPMHPFSTLWCFQRVEEGYIGNEWAKWKERQLVLALFACTTHCKKAKKYQRNVMS